MATGAPVKELCEEATCPICLEYFKDLVMMDDCGHSFCKACLTRYWGESADASCPLCTEAVQQLEEGEKEGGIRERHQESLKLLCKEEDALIGLLRDRSRESWEHSEFPADEASQEYKVTDSSNAGTSNGRKGRGVSWRHKETLDLLDIWGEQKIQDQLRSSHRNIDFFEYIAQEMAARGHRRTAVECRSKTKVMRLEYKRVIGHNSRPGSNKVTCPFYKQLHRILRGDASVKPKRVSRSLNFKRGARQGAAPEPPSTEEHLSHADLPMINIGEYLKEESPDNTGDGMVSSNGAEEEMAETEGINIIQVEEEGSNEGSVFALVTMPRKRKSKAIAGDASKKRKTITIKTKVEIIKRSERGETPSVIGKALGFSRSTVGTILKDKVRIMEHVKGSIPMGATIITKQRSGLIIEMERLLLIWLEDQNQRNIPVSLALVQEKARSLFNDLKTARVASEGDCDEEFAASRGWFNRFKVRANLHNFKVQGEAVSADVSAATEYPKMLKKIIEEGGYVPEQIFNVDETGLFWKKMPERTYIAKEEKNAPGHEAAKDRLTLLLGGNASGDFKLKPLLVYRCPNPTALRRIIKASLPVIWKSNLRAWVTVAIFEDWFLNHFVPAVERYCLDKKIQFKILLVLDNAPGHPSSLDDLHPNVKVVFLPPNTTSLLQPMDQGVIATFKAYYLRRIFSQAVRAVENSVMSLREFWKNYSIYDAIKNIADSWDEVKQSAMKGVWNKVCPQFTNSFQGSTDDSVAEARQAVVDLGNALHLNISEKDVVELLKSHSEELSDEDLMEIEEQLKAHEEEQDIESPEPKRFVTKELAEGFRLAEAAMAKFEEQDPNTERFTKVYRAVTEALSCYKAIYDKKKKMAVQTTLDAYFKKATSVVTPPLSSNRTNP
ncbi:Tigger transposable element-derived protein 1 [Varanus komodoensis]|nr:Tigger transposable element-derived protein 1 [Varanus komodoensis]